MNFDIREKTPMSLALMALDVIGELQTNVETLTFVAMGNYNDILPFAFFHMAHNRFPENHDEVLNCPKCKEGTDRTIARAKFTIQYILRKAEDQEHKDTARQKKQQNAKVANDFKAQHKPAPEGTVKELAAKYGKSISEIRRLKAAGELHTLEEQRI